LENALAAFAMLERLEEAACVGIQMAHHAVPAWWA